MNFLETTLADCFIVEYDKFSDDRGWFARTYCKNEFSAIGFNKDWVQHNHSFTRYKGSIRGMHFQLPPFAETKLVRCISGKVYDVVIDLRKSSVTYLKWIGIELSANNRKMILIPEGFAHGFQTLENDSELLYCHTEFYNPSHESGIHYQDKAIGINWPLSVTQISERDLNHSTITNTFVGL
ncbi:MAG: rfbC [Mucilaginibacter sp.]|nr:rfbC [Mucilaginibacter sp.]